MPVVEARTAGDTAGTSSRYALVIGCNAYQKGGRLSKAVNDATDMHALLKSAGFRSTLVLDATYSDMVLQKQALVNAVRSHPPTAPPPVVCVFFSGHGADTNKNTQFLAVDHNAQPYEDGLHVDELLAELNRVTSNSTIILLADACRADPANTVFKKLVERSEGGGGEVSVSHQEWETAVGLPGAEPPTFRGTAHRDMQSGRRNKFFLGFACKPGTVALECAGERNGYFTKALLTHMPIVGQKLIDAFADVEENVQEWTNNKQGPWHEGDAVAGRFVLVTPPPASNNAVSPQPPCSVPTQPAVLQQDSGTASSAASGTQSVVIPEGVDILTAALKEDAAVVGALLDRGVDINTRDPDGRTPLFISAREGRVDVARLLVNRGADVNAKKKDGATPLHMAAWKGHVDVARLLIEGGADVEEKMWEMNVADGAESRLSVCVFNDGRTPLHIAAEKGHVDVARLLVNRGADVNAKKKDGATPLFIAAQEGHVDVARLLIEGGADVEEKMQDGFKSVHIAAYKGHTHVVGLLLDNRADVNASNNGHTALSLATNKNHTAVVTLLKARGAK